VIYKKRTNSQFFNPNIPTLTFFTNRHLDEKGNTNVACIVKSKD